MTNKCEHELNITEENWISDTEVKVTLECDLCRAKFEGTVVQRE